MKNGLDRNKRQGVKIVFYESTELFYDEAIIDNCRVVNAISEIAGVNVRTRSGGPDHASMVAGGR